MKTTKIFSKNLKSYLNKTSLIINQGGTSSSKTFSILQLLFIVANKSKKPLIISVVSYALPHLKLGAIRDFDKILLDAGINVDKIKNKTDLYYRIGNSIIEFFSADNLAKVHGPRRDILFLNECNHLKYDVYTQLRIRTRICTFLDYNPTNEFWVHEEVIPNEQHDFIKSTYKDNYYLDAKIIEQIESRKGNENWWRVYGLGEVGRLEGAILTNWKFGEFDNTLPFGFGLDFGVKDPDALLKVAIDRKNKLIYWKEEIYQSGNSTGELAQLIKTRITSNNLIIAESASPRTIIDLRSQGLNIKAVEKGKIVDDIKMLQDWTIIVDPESYNLQKELNNWTWLDKKGEVPLDDFNHLLDAGRYYTRMNIKPMTTKGHRIL
jgi:phage terminase large subunit